MSPQVSSRSCLQLLGHMAVHTFATLHSHLHLCCFPSLAQDSLYLQQRQYEQITQSPSLYRGNPVMELVHSPSNPYPGSLFARPPKHHTRWYHQTLHSRSWVGTQQIHTQDIPQLWFSEHRPFTTSVNWKCVKFCSKGGISHHFLGDTFLLCWSRSLLYAFPSVLLILKVFTKADKRKPQ